MLGHPGKVLCSFRIKTELQKVITEVFKTDVKNLKQKILK